MSLAPPTAPSRTASASRWTGLALVGSAVLTVIGYAILGPGFGWPDVLDEPGTVALDAYLDAELAVRVGFTVFLVSSLLLVPAAVGIEGVLSRRGSGARALTMFGVLAAFAQMLGWVRWPLALPGLAQSWVDAGTDAERAAVAASYDVLNGYAGGAVGEHLGWLLQAVWAVGVAVLVLRTASLPRWLGWSGLVTSVAFAVTLPAGTSLGLDGLETLGANLYSVWYVWLLALGVVLVVRPVLPRSPEQVA